MSKTIPQLTAATLPADPAALIEISISGGGSRKLALNTLGFSTLLASGTIASATPEIQLALPTGYVQFELRLMNLLSTANYSNITMQFSSNAGVSWHDGVADYRNVWTKAQYGNDGAVTSQSDEDNQAYLIFDVGIAGDNPASSATILIDPGSASNYPSLRSDSFDRNSSVFPNLSSWGAVLVAEKARQNRIRFQAYIGDSNNMVAGSYALYGIPTP